MDSLTFKFRITVSAPVVILSQGALLGALSSPQQLDYSSQYQKGATSPDDADQALFLAIQLAAGGTATVNFITGSHNNPVGEAATYATLKAYFLAVPFLNADNTETPSAGITALHSTGLAAALGYSASFTRTMKPGHTYGSNYPTGLAVGGTSTVLLTNLDGSSKTTVLLAAGGLKP